MKLGLRVSKCSGCVDFWGRVPSLLFQSRFLSHGSPQVRMGWHMGSLLAYFKEKNPAFTPAPLAFKIPSEHCRGATHSKSPHATMLVHPLIGLLWNDHLPWDWISMEIVALRITSGKRVESVSHRRFKHHPLTRVRRLWRKNAPVLKARCDIAWGSRCFRRGPAAGCSVPRNRRLNHMVHTCMIQCISNQVTTWSPHRYLRRWFNLPFSIASRPNFSNAFLPSSMQTSLSDKCKTCGSK